MVLDSSALLAFVYREPGAAVVAAELVNGAVVSTVIVAEFAAVIRRRDGDPSPVFGALAPHLTVEPLSTEDALSSAAMEPTTRSAGLSLGDRCCLALAQRLGLPVLTADRAWATLPLGVEVRLIR